MKYIILALLLIATPAVADFDEHYAEKTPKLPTEQEYKAAREAVVQSVAKDWCQLDQAAPRTGQIQIRWVRQGGKCVPSYIVGK